MISKLTILSLLATFLVFLPQTSATSRLVLYGTPIKRCTIKITPLVSSNEILTIAENKCDSLERDEQQEYGVSITKDGTNYFWESRGNKPLLLNHSGLYYKFISNAGYIKIIDCSYNTDFLINPCPKWAYGKIAYIEHMDSGLSTWTYIGTIGHFQP